MINQEVKGTLAKLLATENLTVEHRKVSTAAFDTERRVLILPIWKTASSTVYDLLVGHEVGHALYTPNKDFGNVSKAFVNVLEDARIERLMKQTYPGLRKSFFEGYKQLWDQDFFGVKNDDPETLSLIDRINLYFKGNVQIPFTAEERVWIDRVDRTVTFDDVVALAKELWEYANQKQEQKEEEMMMPPSPNGNKTADREEEMNPSDSSEAESQEGEGNQEQQDQADREESDADLETPSYSDVGGDVDETESITDAALREALDSLVDDDAKEWVYLTLPKIDAEEYIVSPERISEDLEFSFYGQAMTCKEMQRQYFKTLEYAENHYNSFKKDTQKTVNYLCKQFEMKKSAEEYKRAATSKTGVIDTNSLFKYKMTDDIFKKVTVVSEGKNHGLVMFLDWSGSMSNVLMDTLKQTMNLVWFCKKCGIPFRVFGFQSGYYSHREERGTECEVNELAIANDFRLLEFFSSKQSARSLEKSMRMVYLQVFALCGRYLLSNNSYSLGGTPLAESVMCARSIVAEMKRTENVSKVNVICLTDGEANPMSYVRTYTNYYTQEIEKKMSLLCHNRNIVFILRDSVTGYSRRLGAHAQHTTKEIVSFHKEITDYNWIGIRICSKQEAFRLIREYAYDKYEEIDKMWKKEKFASIKQTAGFTESFYLPNNNLGSSSNDLEVKQKTEVATKAELTRAFKKHMGSKMTNKTILNSFITQIA